MKVLGVGLRAWGWIGLFFFVAVFWYLSQNTYWAHSEIWAIAASQYFYFPEIETGGAFYKPVFNFVVGWNHFLTGNSVDLFMSARTQFFFVGLTIIFLQYRFARKIFNSDSRWPLISVLLTISSYLFLARGYRVRSDILATALVLGFLCLGFEWVKKGQRIRDVFGAILMAALALMTTPKAVFILLGSTIFLFLINQKKGEKGYSYRIWIVWAMACLLIAASLLGLSAYLNKELDQFILRPWVYFKNTFSGEEAKTVEYLSPVSFMHVRRALSDQVVFFVLLFFSWVFRAIPKLRAYDYSNHLQIAWIKASAFIFLCFYLYPDKHPFYLASLMPFFAISSALMLKNFLHPARDMWGIGVEIRKLAYVMLPLLILYQAYTQCKLLVDVNNNWGQKKAMYYLIDYFKSHGEGRVFTGMGLFPKENDTMVFLGPANQDKNDVKTLSFLENLPEFVVRTSKLDYLKPNITNILSENYIGFLSGLFVKALRTEVGNSPIRWRKVGEDIIIDAEVIYDLYVSRFGIPEGEERIYFYKEGAENTMETRLVSWARNDGVFIEVHGAGVRVSDLKRKGLLYFKEDDGPTWLTRYPYPGSSIDDHTDYRALFSFDGAF